MCRVLIACLALVPRGSDCLGVPRQGRLERAPWEFVSGWARPGPYPAEWAPSPDLSRPAPVAMHAYYPRQRAGIQFVTPTYKKQIYHAAMVQDSFAQFLGADDSVVNVVDPDCKEDGRLKSVVVLPAEYLNKTKAYYRANLKHVFGATYVAAELMKRNATTWPLWWVLKDDDTYVSVHNLRADLAARDPSTPLLLGAAFGEHIVGGSGMALSWKAVEKIVFENKSLQWLDLMIDNVKKNRIHMDYYMPGDIKRHFVPNLDIVNDLNFQNSLQRCPETFHPKDMDERSQCHLVPGVCKCARSDAPAMWHLMFHGGLPLKIDRLEKYERTFGGQ